MRVLVACEFSGVVREAFRARGHDAWSCDLLPTEMAGPHLQCDVREILGQNWDLMVAHPPCTYLANSGVQYLHKQQGRWQLMEEAKKFFLILLEAKIPKIAVENPVPHKYAQLPHYTQIVQPYFFGDCVQKKTCLWLKGLPKLQATNVVDKGKTYIGQDGKLKGSEWYFMALRSQERWKIRSRTFPGIAQAMVEQWG